MSYVFLFFLMKERRHNSCCCCTAFTSNSLPTTTFFPAGVCKWILFICLHVLFKAYKKAGCHGYQITQASAKTNSGLFGSFIYAATDVRSGGTSLLYQASSFYKYADDNKEVAPWSRLLSPPLSSSVYVTWQVCASLLPHVPPPLQ